MIPSDSLPFSPLPSPHTNIVPTLFYPGVQQPSATSQSAYTTNPGTLIAWEVATSYSIAKEEEYLKEQKRLTQKDQVELN